MDEAILDDGIGGVIVALRAGRGIDLGEVLRLAVFEQRIAHGGGVAHEAHAAGSGIVDVAALDQDAAVVVVHKNGIAADLVEHAIEDVDLLGAGEQERAAAVDRPVRAQERFLTIHESARRVPHGEALEGDVFHGLLVRAVEFHQMPQADDFHFRSGQVGSGFGEKIQRRGLAVVEPLAGGVEFLEDVFHHAEILVHAHLTVVLPTALIGDISRRVLAGDAVVVAAPAGDVHGMDEAASWVRPLRRAFLGKGIRRVTLVGGGFFRGIEVRIAGHALGLAIDKQLVDLQALRRRGLEDAVAEWLPIQLEFRSAAQEGAAFVHGAVRHRKLRTAGVRRSHHQSFRQMVNPVAHMNNNRLLGCHFSDGIASRRQRGEGRALRAGIGVLARRGDMKVKREGLPCESKSHDAREGL